MTFTLPESHRSTLRAFAALGGAAVCVAFAWLVVTGAGASAIALGVALVVTGALGGAYLARDQPVALAIDGATGELTLTGADGSSATLPRRAIRGAGVIVVPKHGPHARSAALQHVTYLYKQDGGMLSLGACKEAAARPLAAEISRALDEAALVAPPDDDARDPTSYLRGSRRVRITRAADPAGDIELSWRSLPPLATIVPATLVPLGIAIAAVGANLLTAQSGLLVFAALMAIVVLVFLGSLVRDFGAEEVVRVGATQLFIERRRGARRLEQRVVQLDAISAIDFSQMAGAMDTGLTIRLGDSSSEAAVPSSDAVLDDGAQIAKADIFVPLGRLSLGDRIGVDLALSCAVAQRTQRASSML